MKLNIIQVAFKYLIVMGFLVVAGCSVYTPPEEKQMSQLEWRQLQSKTFSSQEEIVVLKATIAALQDTGYSITSSNVDTGLISAINITEIDGGCSAPIGRQPYCLVAIEENVTATIAKIAKGQIRVRVSIKKNGKTDKGSVEWTRNVGDVKVYTNIFSKIDKSIFLQTENL